ncbi:MAG: DUF885 family protein, partial [Nannocystaceae bacterium]
MLRSSVPVLLTLALLTAASCRAPAAPAPVETASPAPDSDAPFAEQRDEIVRSYYALYPARAVALGLHEYDGKLRDATASGIELELEFMEDALARLEAIDPATLPPLERVELGTLQVALRAERFELKQRRSPWRNPMFYLEDLNLTPYIARDYAPLAQRAAAIVAVAEASPAFLASAAANLESALPRTFIDTALLQVRGTIAFVQTDVPTAMAGLPAETKAKLEAALGTMVEALSSYEAQLVQRQGTATDDYALGPEGFVDMLRQTQGIDVDLSTLREIGQADLDRNLAALEAAAKQIAPKAKVRATIEKVRREKPK